MLVEFINREEFGVDVKEESDDSVVRVSCTDDVEEEIGVDNTEFWVVNSEEELRANDEEDLKVDKLREDFDDKEIGDSEERREIGGREGEREDDVKFNFASEDMEDDLRKESGFEPNLFLPKR